MTRVLVAGHVNRDVTLVVDRLPATDEEVPVRERYRCGGGSAANVAVGLAGLAVPVELLGSVGDDEAGERVRSSLADRGIGLERLRTVPGETSTKYLLVAGDEVAVLGVDGVNEAVGPGDVGPQDLADVDHVHLTGQRVATAERLAALAADAGCTVSLDPGRRAGDRAFASAVEQADLLFGTDREIAALSADAPVDADSTIGETTDELQNGETDGELQNGMATDELRIGKTDDELQIVETSGAGGATWHGATETLTHPGFAVDVADTSGAGDAFVAGFLSAWLDGDGPERALEIGNACGAIASREIGARTDLDRDAVVGVLNPE